jgi:hypothetical protein
VFKKQENLNMSDDLVKQLRAARESGDPWAAWHLALQTADRIEKLEAALRKYGSNFCEFACGEPCGHLEWDQCSGCEAYKALEGKDD